MGERDEANVLALIAFEALRIAHHFIDVAAPHRLSRWTGSDVRRQILDPAAYAFDIVGLRFGGPRASENLQRRVARL
jgi:hypothetical protein